MDTRAPSPLYSPDEANGVQSVAGAVNTRDDGLSSEVQMLSTKLINAINFSTNLDDTLQSTRQELERAQKELAKVQAEKKSLDDAVSLGMLVRRADVDKTIERLRFDLSRERVERDKAEKAKKQTESELENLTSALFEEANSMVASARRNTEAAERRNSQLKDQLSETETLLASQQEQLHDLKLTMERFERTESSKDGSVPSTPATAPGQGMDASLLMSPGDPDSPLSFSQLLHPVLRNDVSAYCDFAELINAGRAAAPHSRNASGSAVSSSLVSPGSHPAATRSSPNLPGAFGFANSGLYSANVSPSTSTPASTTVPALKDAKFYKRILVEDIEPTLRLDLAPGLSFLSRRTVMNSILNGGLVVEPFNPITKYSFGPIFACALCGESRREEPYLRKHRFKTSESEDAQRYPLCDYCLGRVRAAADFLGFLRMVRGGHWRCEGHEAEREAWEEAVKLRERMFWARIGGGVTLRAAIGSHSPFEQAHAKSATGPGSRRRSSVLQEAGGAREDKECPDEKDSVVSPMMTERTEEDALQKQAPECLSTEVSRSERPNAENSGLRIQTSALKPREGLLSGGHGVDGPFSATSAVRKPVAQSPQPQQGSTGPGASKVASSKSDDRPSTPTLVVQNSESRSRPNDAVASPAINSPSATPPRSQASRSPSTSKIRATGAYDAHRPTSPSKLNTDGSRSPSRSSLQQTTGSTESSPERKHPAVYSNSLASTVLARVRAMEKQ